MKTTDSTQKPALMKFIKLKHGNDKKITYTVRIDSISCVETYVGDDGKINTWLHSKDFENGQLYVKETEEEIFQMIKGVEKIAVLS